MPDRLGSKITNLPGTIIYAIIRVWLLRDQIEKTTDKENNIWRKQQLENIDIDIEKSPDKV